MCLKSLFSYLAQTLHSFLFPLFHSFVAHNLVCLFSWDCFFYFPLLLFLRTSFILCLVYIILIFHSPFNIVTRFNVSFLLLVYFLFTSLIYTLGCFSLLSLFYLASRFHNIVQHCFLLWCFSVSLMFSPTYSQVLQYHSRLLSLLCLVITAHTLF